MTTTKEIAGRPTEEWLERLPLLRKVRAAEEVLWTNPALAPLAGRVISPELGLADIEDAGRRLARFAPYLARVFPDTAPGGGIIESSLRPLDRMAGVLGAGGPGKAGNILLKLDSHLPVSGSVKARGGVYEVLKTAEDFALAAGLITPDSDYAKFADDEIRTFLSGRGLVVGSTGNLGLSIGITGAMMGFRVCVHMSGDARQWKKDLLREKGAVVVEHAGDYGLAVAAGRRESESDPKSHFVDDENSKTLFLGYAVAALRLRDQLEKMNVKVGPRNPLFIYLPCGVGGAPGGLTFGLRTVFGDDAHCFLAEPTRSPCMLLGLMTGLHSAVSVEDFGLDNKTEADGLAVARPSGFVGRTLARDIAGVLTVSDERLKNLLTQLARLENIRLEPSALAGFPGPRLLAENPAGKAYLEKHGLTESWPDATHVLWATGGGMVPPDVWLGFLDPADRAEFQ
ncbi:MAG: D-serine ammonia-lyase [Deltaproteobacteria bacterium]|jgi:D-serine dehydratase|nr:D-serine ammonia-lyase [Deltaproteobacteria bacterium]